MLQGPLIEYANEVTFGPSYIHISSYNPFKACYYFSHDGMEYLFVVSLTTLSVSQMNDLIY
jgi:hypothetical protein